MKNLIVIDKNKLMDSYCRFQTALIAEIEVRKEYERCNSKTEREKKAFFDLINGAETLDALAEKEIKRRVGDNASNSSFDDGVEGVYKYMSYCLENRKVIDGRNPSITVPVSQKYSDKVLNAVKTKLESDGWSYVEWQRPVDEMKPIEFTVG